jgi:Ca-activated chloride channel family protein
MNLRFMIYDLRFKVIIILILNSPFSILNSFGQSDRALIRDGNKSFLSGAYDEAMDRYQRSLDKNPNSVAGNFNIGDVYYKQKKYDSAATHFQTASGMTTDKDTLAKVYHNLGNSYLQQKKYEESIDAYKNSLRNNPNDNDTKYNLAYAQAMYKKEKQQQQQNQDKDKDKKDQDKKDKEQEKKDQQSKDDKDKKDQQEKKEGSPNKMTKEQAERILQALNNQDKDAQKKNLKKVTVQGVQIEKTW